MATPTIPQRPARSQDQPTQSAGVDIPQIPPRPNRDIARSISPDRNKYARSPLNDPTYLHNKPHGASGLSKQISREVLARPPSVDFPSVGHEGDEYGQVQSYSPQLVPSEATKQISGDLPLHAPKAALPASIARSKIAPVTRTDSNQAAAAGIGKPSSESGEAKDRRWSSSQPSTSRPQSLYGKEAEEANHGIPAIGLQIPLFKYAGDVQAPTPPPSAPGQTRHAPPSAAAQTGGRNHFRTKSGREVFAGPPGSYGLHGHGKRPTDALEAAWYQKHPDELAREAKGEYGPAISDNRKEWTLSSEDLNRLVHTENSLESMGASPGMIGTPDEQIGYLASEAYSSRMNSPRPASIRRASSKHADSPLRTVATPGNDGTDEALESDGEHDDGVINVEPPSSIRNKYTGAGYDPPTQDLGPNGGNTARGGGYITEDGHGVPILASDEVSHRPGAQLKLPAVEPGQERRGNEYHIGDGDYPPGRANSSNSHSRENSMAAPSNLTRFASFEGREHTGTPLDDVKEYEPLFPDENDDEKTTQKKFDALRKKRPDLARHHFPSKDIWEDTPESSMYEAEVDAPQLPDNAQRAAEHEPTEFFETPEQEAARKSNITAADQENFLSEHTKKLAKTSLPAHVMADMPTRPGRRHRFPSRDVWEDSPDSTMHTTEVSPEPEEDAIAPPPQSDATPSIPARPARSRIEGEIDGASDASPVDKQAPSIPARPKPQVPSRPAKSTSEEGGAPLDLTKSTSSERERPAVPARPVGGKIAALQAGFMENLNNRLKLGPQAPKKEEVVKSPEEEEAEKAPLADARKGRAKGPSRRKPGVSPSAAASEDASAAKPAVKFSFASSWTVYEIDNDSIIVPRSLVQTQPFARGPPAEVAEGIEAEPAGLEPVGQSTKEATGVAAENEQDPAAPTQDDAHPTSAEPAVLLAGQDEHLL